MGAVVNLRKKQKVRLLSIGDRQIDVKARVDSISAVYIALSLENLSNEEFMALMKGVNAGTRFVLSTGFSNGLYKINCAFRSFRLPPEKLIYLEHAQVNDKVQRRSYIRIPMEGEVEYAVVSEALYKLMGGIANLSMVRTSLDYEIGQAVNVSIGGLLLQTKKEIEKGAMLSLIIKGMPDIDKVLATAEVMHCKPSDDFRNEFELGLRFFDESGEGMRSPSFARSLAKLERSWMKTLQDK